MSSLFDKKYMLFSQLNRKVYSEKRLTLRCVTFRPHRQLSVYQDYKSYRKFFSQCNCVKSKISHDKVENLFKHRREKLRNSQNSWRQTIFMLSQHFFCRERFLKCKFLQIRRKFETQRSAYLSWSPWHYPNKIYSLDS